MLLGLLAEQYQRLLAVLEEVLFDLGAVLGYLVDKVVDGLAVSPDQADVVFYGRGSGLQCFVCGQCAGDGHWRVLGLAGLDEVGQEALGRRDVFAEVDVLVNGSDHGLEATDKVPYGLGEEIGVLLAEDPDDFVPVSDCKQG